jgi:signal peptide peptidase SppA
MTIHRFAHLAQGMFNTPLMIHPAKAEVIVAALAERLGVTRIEVAGGHSAMDDDGDDDWSSPAPSRPDRDPGYDLIGPVAMVGVRGTLVQRQSSLRPYSGMTGYNGLRQTILAAANDDAVKGIMLDIDSPGGSVSGCFDLVDTIWKVGRDKPIRAVLSENAYSAAYAIACAASDGIYVPRTGGTGSIGVIWVHANYADALAKEGIKVTIVKTGKRKDDFSELKDLSDEAREQAQADSDAIAAIFHEVVARGRGISTKAAADLEAACFMGQAGVAQGLADKVMAPDAAFRDFVRKLS